MEAADCALTGDLVRLDGEPTSINEGNVNDAVQRRDSVVFCHLINVADYITLTKVNFSWLSDLLDLSPEDVREALQSLAAVGVIVIEQAKRGSVGVRLIRVEPPKVKTTSERMRELGIKIVA